MQFVTLPYYLILGFPLQEQFWALVWACRIGPGVILASLTLLMFQLLMVLKVNVILILVISQFPSWKPPLFCNPPWLVVGGWLELRKCCLFHFCHVTQSWFQWFSLRQVGVHKCCMSWVWLRNKAVLNDTCLSQWEKIWNGEDSGIHRCCITSLRIMYWLTGHFLNSNKPPAPSCEPLEDSCGFQVGHWGIFT